MAESTGVLIRPPELARNSALPWVQMATGLLLTAVADAQIAARIHDATPDDAVLIWLAVAQGLCGLALAATALLHRRVLRTAHVRLTEAGLINRQVRDRLVPWTRIADIETIPRGGAWRVCLTLHSGRRMTLVAPLTRKSSPDPHFAAHRDTIIVWWRHLS